MSRERNNVVDCLVLQLARDRDAIVTQLRIQHDHLIDELRRLNMSGELPVTPPLEVLGKQKRKMGETTFQPERRSMTRTHSMPEPEMSDKVPTERQACDLHPMHSAKKIDMDPLQNNQEKEIEECTMDIDQCELNADNQMTTGSIEEKNPMKAQDMARVLREHVPVTEPKANSCLNKMAMHPMFEVTSCILVLLSIITMAAEIQYRGLKTGYEYQLSTAAFDPSAWTGAELTFAITEHFFNVAFTTELILRILAWRCHAFKSFWINLDVIIVCTSILASSDVATVDLSMMRVVRLARAIRVLKVVRFVRSFDSMFVLIRSIQASGSAFFWSFMLLFSIQIAGGMFLHQVLKPCMTDAHFSIKQREDIYNVYGTFTKTMLTMFEVTFANWVPVCRMLVSNVSESFALFFILYRCMFCFAIVKVIAAVFISETNRIVAGDAELALVKSQRAREDYARKLQTMFKVLDKSGDGKISWDEFQVLLSDDVTKAWAAAMEIDTRELQELFTYLDTGDGEVTLDEFMAGIPKMKGNARSTDSVHMLALARRMEYKINSLQESMSNLCQNKRIGYSLLI